MCRGPGYSIHGGHEVARSYEISRPNAFRTSRRLRLCSGSRSSGSRAGHRLFETGEGLSTGSRRERRRVPAPVAIGLFALAAGDGRPLYQGPSTRSPLVSASADGRSYLLVSWRRGSSPWPFCSRGRTRRTDALLLAGAPAQRAPAALAVAAAPPCRVARSGRLQAPARPRFTSTSGMCRLPRALALWWSGFWLDAIPPGWLVLPGRGARSMVFVVLVVYPTTRAAPADVGCRAGAVRPSSPRPSGFPPERSRPAPVSGPRADTSAVNRLEDLPSLARPSAPVLPSACWSPRSSRAAPGRDGPRPSPLPRRPCAT